jgi:hypothetical protein
MEGPSTPVEAEGLDGGEHADAKQFIRETVEQLWEIDDLGKDSVASAVRHRILGFRDVPMLHIISEFLGPTLDRLLTPAARENTVKKLTREGHIEDYVLENRDRAYIMPSGKTGYPLLPLTQIPNAIKDHMRKFRRWFYDRALYYDAQRFLDVMGQNPDEIPEGVTYEELALITRDYFRVLIERVETAVLEVKENTMLYYYAIFEAYWDVDNMVQTANEMFPEPSKIAARENMFLEYVAAGRRGNELFGNLLEKTANNEAKIQAILAWRSAVAAGTTGEMGLEDIPIDHIYGHILPMILDPSNPRGLLILAATSSFESWVNRETTIGSGVSIPSEFVGHLIAKSLSEVEVKTRKLLAIDNVDLRRLVYFEGEERGESIGEREQEYLSRIEKWKLRIVELEGLSNVILNPASEDGRRHFLSFLRFTELRAANARSTASLESIRDFSTFSRAQLVNELANVVLVELRERRLTIDNTRMIVRSALQRNIIKYRVAIENVQADMQRIEDSIERELVLPSSSPKKRKRGLVGHKIRAYFAKHAVPQGTDPTTIETVAEDDVGDDVGEKEGNKAALLF